MYVSSMANLFCKENYVSPPIAKSSSLYNDVFHQECARGRLAHGIRLSKRSSQHII